MRETAKRRKEEGIVFSDEHKRKLSEAAKGRVGKKNSNWRGGYFTEGLTYYDTYAQQLEWCEEVRRSPKDGNILEIRCAYCGKWFAPKQHSVRNRICSLNKYNDTRLYCSKQCKQECPIYKQVKYPKDFKQNTSREVQPQLRQIVFERDEYTCQKCGSTESLHCHHITGIELNPIESADVDNCITLCKKCHKEVHAQDGCKYNDMKKDKCNE